MNEHQSTSQANEKQQRPGYFETIIASLKHINSSANTEGKKIRTSDYVPILILPVAAFALAMCTAVPAAPFRRYFLAALTAVLLYLIGARFGVIRTLGPRQAYIISILMFACFLLGCTVSLIIGELLNMFLN